VVLAVVVALREVELAALVDFMVAAEAEAINLVHLALVVLVEMAL
jgi:hypothetical protein